MVDLQQHTVVSSRSATPTARPMVARQHGPPEPGTGKGVAVQLWKDGIAGCGGGWLRLRICVILRHSLEIPLFKPVNPLGKAVIAVRLGDKKRLEAPDLLVEWDVRAPMLPIEGVEPWLIVPRFSGRCSN